MQETRFPSQTALRFKRVAQISESRFPTQAALRFKRLAQISESRFPSQAALRFERVAQISESRFPETASFIRMSSGGWRRAILREMGTVSHQPVDHVHVLGT